MRTHRIETTTSLAKLYLRSNHSISDLHGVAMGSRVPAINLSGANYKAGQVK